MAQLFTFRAVDRGGRRLRGREEAASEAALLRTLEQRGLVVLDVARTEERSAGARKVLGGSRRQGVLEVTRALAALLGAEMPLARALAIAANVAPGDVGAVLPRVRESVERGVAVADALAEHGGLFSPLYVGVVRAGDRSGDLAGAFARLATQLERDEEIRARLVSASIYPLLLAGVGSVALAILLLFVLPRFTELLEGAGASLPPSTAMLLSFSSVLRRYGWVLAGALLLLVGGIAPSRRTEGGRLAGARVLVSLPLVRSLRRQVLAARFARLLGVLLGGGAPLLAALGDTAESLDDPLARAETARIRSRVREGASLRQAIAEGGLYPDLLAQLVAVGEESGRLHEFLLEAAGIFETGTERLLKRLVSLAEPAMIVGFGLVVGLVALSLLQAIYGINADAFR